MGPSHTQPTLLIYVTSWPRAIWSLKIHLNTYSELYFCRLKWLVNPVLQQKKTLLCRNSYLKETKERKSMKEAQR